MLNRKHHLSLAIATGTTLALLSIGPALAEVRDVYIQTVRIDGKTNVNGDATHEPEPFPPAAMAEGRGLQLTEPND